MITPLLLVRDLRSVTGAQARFVGYPFLGIRITCYGWDYARQTWIPDNRKADKTNNVRDTAIVCPS